MPQTPKKKAEVIKQLIKSPATFKVLRDEGVITNTEYRRKLESGDSVISSIKTDLDEIKAPNSSNSDKRHAHSILRSSIMKNIQSRNKNYMKKLFSFSYKSKLAKKEWWKKSTRQ